MSPRKKDETIFIGRVERVTPETVYTHLVPLDEKKGRVCDVYLEPSVFGDRTPNVGDQFEYTVTESQDAVTFKLKPIEPRLLTDKDYEDAEKMFPPL